MDWCDWRRGLHHSQRLRSFLMRDLWSGHAPQALVVVLGLLRPFAGREHHDRGVRGTDADVRDRRQPRERRAQLGLARLRGVAGPGDLADARRVVVLGTRGQAALPPFCSAGLGRRRWLPCGAPLHLSCSGGARFGGGLCGWLIRGRAGSLFCLAGVLRLPLSHSARLWVAGAPRLPRGA